MTRPSGIDEAPPNTPLHARQVLRIDCEPAERVLKLTGFQDGAQMRKVFHELGLEDLLRHMPRDRRTYKCEQFDEAFRRVEGKLYVRQETFERCRKKFTDGEYHDSFVESTGDDLHVSRLPNVNIFGLVCVVVFGGLDFGSAACLPYFNLSEQHTSLLFHNAVQLVGPAMAAVWAPKVRSKAWLLENCRPPVLVETESDCEDDLFDEDGREEAAKPSHEECRAIYRSDLVFLIDGMDRKCQHSQNMLDQSMEFGVKTKTLQFHGVRWSMISNLEGHIVFRSHGAAHSVAEIDLVTKCGFFQGVDDAFKGAEQKLKVALVCDRGYYKLDVAKINKTLKNLVLRLYLPVHLNVPHVRVPRKRTKFDADEAELNIVIASIRNVNEIANLHVEQIKIYQRRIPLALLHSLDHIDEVADSTANIRAGAQPECSQSKK